MTPTAEEIQNWIVARISALTGLPREQIDPKEDMFRYGLDSIAVLKVATDLENWLGFRFKENPVEAFFTISDLARYLAEQVASCK